MAPSYAPCVTHVRRVVHCRSAVVPAHDPGLLCDKVDLPPHRRISSPSRPTAPLSSSKRTLVRVSELYTLSTGSGLARVGTCHGAWATAGFAFDASEANILRAAIEREGGAKGGMWLKMRFELRSMRYGAGCGRARDGQSQAATLHTTRDVTRTLALVYMFLQDRYAQ